MSDFVTRSFTFQNEGSRLAATLTLPATFEGAPLPTVVITGAWTTVQEQMPRNYAHAMVSRGYAAVTFDFRGWGKSGDLPGGVRYLENPQAKTSDICAAIAATAARPEVAAENLNGLGICASAGYMVDAVSGNPAIRAVGLVAPWLQNAALVEAVYGGAEGVAGLIAMGRAAQAAGGQIIRAAGPEGADGVLMPLGGYYWEPSRGAVPEYDDRWNVASWEGWLTYHPADHAAALDKPLALVHSDNAMIPDGARAFAAAAAAPVTEAWFDAFDQFDFYDRPMAVQMAADVLAKHFVG
ncbi:MAG: CocE/NonD family hydrolase [Pseudomonadota bacterium]